MNEEKTNEQAEQEATATDNDAGNEPQADEEVKRLNEETERLNRAIAEKENAEARAKAGGITTAGKEPEKQKEISDVEYSKNALAGKYNK